jgi:hypothetical protein
MTMMNNESNSGNGSKVMPVVDKTIHHAVNFHPEDYEILDYLDNRPPRFEPPMSAHFSHEAFQAMVREYELDRKRWNDEMDRYFPHRAKRQPSIHHCTHCGNGNVRYIVAVHHKPTGQNVVFGSDCVVRLGFANQNAFKLAQIKARAEAGHARMRIIAARTKFLADNPEFAALVNNKEELLNPVHAKNDFARDILAKLDKYGSLSPKQVEAFANSLKRDHEYAARKAADASKPKGPVPTGRVEFNCIVISHRWQDNDFGGCVKMLVELENGSRVWMTAPSSIGSDLAKGAKLRLRAAIEASKDDPSFGFGKRPHLISCEAPEQAEVAALAK